MKTFNHPLRLFQFCPKCGSGHFIENNKQSKRCETCGFVLYFNPKGAVVGIITNEKGDILVCRRAKEPAKGMLDLPGGFMDSFETAEEAIAREIKEETGLTVTNSKYLFSLPNTYLYSEFEVHTIDLFFLCQVTSLQHLIPQDDVESCQFMPKEQIHPENFGLASIQKGIKILLNRQII